MEVPLRPTPVPESIPKPESPLPLPQAVEAPQQVPQPSFDTTKYREGFGITQFDRDALISSRTTARKKGADDAIGIVNKLLIAKNSRVPNRYGADLQDGWNEHVRTSYLKAYVDRRKSNHPFSVPSVAKSSLQGPNKQLAIYEELARIKKGDKSIKGGIDRTFLASVTQAEMLPVLGGLVENGYDLTNLKDALFNKKRSSTDIYQNALGEIQTASEILQNIGKNEVLDFLVDSGIIDAGKINKPSTDSMDHGNKGMSYEQLFMPQTIKMIDSLASLSLQTETDPIKRRETFKRFFRDESDVDSPAIPKAIGSHIAEFFINNPGIENKLTGDLAESFRQIAEISRAHPDLLPEEQNLLIGFAMENSQDLSSYFINSRLTPEGFAKLQESMPDISSIYYIQPDTSFEQRNLSFILGLKPSMSPTEYKTLSDFMTALPDEQFVNSFSFSPFSADGLLTDGNLNGNVLLGLASRVEAPEMDTEIFNPTVYAKFSETDQKFWHFWQNTNTNKQLLAQTVIDLGGITEAITSNITTIEAVSSRIDNSYSAELKNFKGLVIKEIISSENPAESFEKVIQIFERNNIPEVGKIYRVFNLLNPPSVIERKIANLNKAELSPSLLSATDSEKRKIIYADLLKVHIESANPSLLSFLKDFRQNGIVIDQFPTFDEAIINQFSQSQLSLLHRFLDRVEVTTDTKSSGSQTDSISERTRLLREALAIPPDGSLQDRLTEAFATPLGYTSLTEVIDRMEEVKKIAEQRGIELSASGKIPIVAGDLIKGIKDEFLPEILGNGSVSKEYLGVPDDLSDGTPFDTDFIKIRGANSRAEINMKKHVKQSYSRRYGDLQLIFRDRGQFVEDTPNAPTEQRKYSLIHSGFRRAEHYGIRTGIPSTEIDFVISDLSSSSADRQRLQRAFFFISQNDQYIPVVDNTGDVIFNKTDFGSYQLSPEVVKTASEPDFKPSDLLDSLTTNPYLKTVYESGTGVKEKYSLRNHTEMVMRQFERYFSDRWKDTYTQTGDPQSVLSKSEMRILLALHDIGKPESVQRSQSTSRQHEFNAKLIPNMLRRMGLKDESVKRITAVATQDILGEFIQGDITQGAAKIAIQNMSHHLAVPADSLLHLLEAYYMSDASAYTEDAGGKHSLDRLFKIKRKGEKGSIEFNEEIGKKIADLRAEIQADIGPTREERLQKEIATKETLQETEDQEDLEEVRSELETISEIRESNPNLPTKERRELTNDEKTKIRNQLNKLNSTWSTQFKEGEPRTTELETATLLSPLSHDVFPYLIDLYKDPESSHIVRQYLSRYINASAEKPQDTLDVIDIFTDPALSQVYDVRAGLEELFNLDSVIKRTIYTSRQEKNTRDLDTITGKLIEKISERKAGGYVYDKLITSLALTGTQQAKEFLDSLPKEDLEREARNYNSLLTNPEEIQNQPGTMIHNSFKNESTLSPFARAVPLAA